MLTRPKALRRSLRRRVGDDSRCSALGRQRIRRSAHSWRRPRAARAAEGLQWSEPSDEVETGALRERHRARRARDITLQRDVANLRGGARNSLSRVAPRSSSRAGWSMTFGARETHVLDSRDTAASLNGEILSLDLLTRFVQRPSIVLRRRVEI